jgi:hypothetical protein
MSNSLSATSTLEVGRRLGGNCRAAAVSVSVSMGAAASGTVRRGWPGGEPYSPSDAKPPRLRLAWLRVVLCRSSCNEDWTAPPGLPLATGAPLGRAATDALRPMGDDSTPPATARVAPATPGPWGSGCPGDSDRLAPDTDTPRRNGRFLGLTLWSRSLSSPRRSVGDCFSRRMAALTSSVDTSGGQRKHAGAEQQQRHGVRWSASSAVRRSSSCRVPGVDESGAGGNEDARKLGMHTHGALRHPLRRPHLARRWARPARYRQPWRPPTMTTSRSRAWDGAHTSSQHPRGTWQRDSFSPAAVCTHPRTHAHTHVAGAAEQGVACEAEHRAWAGCHRGQRGPRGCEGTRPGPTGEPARRHAGDSLGSATHPKVQACAGGGGGAQQPPGAGVPRPRPRTRQTAVGAAVGQRRDSVSDPRRGLLPPVRRRQLGRHRVRGQHHRHGGGVVAVQTKGGGQVGHRLRQVPYMRQGAHALAPAQAPGSDTGLCNLGCRRRTRRRPVLIRVGVAGGAGSQTVPHRGPSLAAALRAADRIRATARGVPNTTRGQNGRKGLPGHNHAQCSTHQAGDTTAGRCKRLTAPAGALARTAAPDTGQRAAPPRTTHTLRRLSWDWDWAWAWAWEGRWTALPPWADSVSAAPASPARRASSGCCRLRSPWPWPAVLVRSVAPAAAGNECTRG